MLMVAKPCVLVAVGWAIFHLYCGSVMLILVEVNIPFMAQSIDFFNFSTCKSCLRETYPHCPYHWPHSSAFPLSKCTFFVDKEVEV